MKNKKKGLIKNNPKRHLQKKIDKKKIKLNYREILRIGAVIFILIIVYFIYQYKEDILILLKDKEILYYIFGGLLIGGILVLIIGFFNKVRIPNFKHKKDIDKKKFEITKLGIPLKKCETYFDQLYDLVNEGGSIDIEEVMKKFNVSRDNAEKWGKILEEHGLIKLYYHGLNKISFKKW